MISAQAAANLIPDGTTVMLCGPSPVGAPSRIVNALVARRARDLTLLVPDLAVPGAGVSLLIEARCVTRIVAARLGDNPVARRRLMRSEFDLDLVGPERFLERIRAAGRGLGGILMPTDSRGQPGQQPVLDLDGRSFSVERPLRACFAVLVAREADSSFNLAYAHGTPEVAPLMAEAADCVMAEAELMPAPAALPVSALQTSGVRVSYLVPAAP
ncbi:CoA-transferase [Falsiroseomonas oryzae]|uniref:CoA-transferase n=1 Tax=Falsiroseomonas oryzae TaxID=2766473 RepID=UPI0022EB3441|nr:CoA-transferase [Roseomonas sp. MO-31]